MLKTTSRISKILIIAILALVIISIPVFAPSRFFLQNLFITNSSPLSTNVNLSVIINCKAEQAGSGGSLVSATTCHHWIQWNQSNLAWANASESFNTVYINGTNPTNWTLGTTNSAQNLSVAWQKLNITKAGVYNIRCFEPKEDCNNNATNGLASSIITINVTTCNINGSVAWNVDCAENCIVKDGSRTPTNITTYGTGTITLTNASVMFASAAILPTCKIAIDSNSQFGRK